MPIPPALAEATGVIAAVATSAGTRIVGIGSRWGLGSGFIVDDNRVVTNAHNVRGEEATVVFGDGREITGSATRDVDADLAVLTVETEALGPLGWSSAEPSLGDPVVALAASGGRGIRATLGQVSGLDLSFRGPRNLRITGAIEHTAPMGRGSSGGPLLDTDGQLIGINTHRLGDGLYLAVPASALRERIDALARGDVPARPRLGIALTPDRAARRLREAVGLPELDGVLVHAVEEGGPADRAGLRRGDLVVRAAGRGLARPEDLLSALSAHAPGTPVVLSVVRGSEELEVTVEPEDASAG